MGKERISQDHPIDYKCISINVDGLPNSIKHPKCDKNGSSDGFVYTTSTEKRDDGDYWYRYADMADAGKHILTVPGDYDDWRTCATKVRDADKGEGRINFMAAIAGSQFTGSATDNNKFVYNEGQHVNSEGIPSSMTGENDTQAMYDELLGDKVQDATNFYDSQTQAYSDQLIKVRNLQPK